MKVIAGDWIRLERAVRIADGSWVPSGRIGRVEDVGVEMLLIDFCGVRAGVKREDALIYPGPCPMAHHSGNRRETCEGCADSNRERIKSSRVDLSKRTMVPNGLLAALLDVAPGALGTQARADLGEGVISGLDRASRQ